MNYVPQDRLQDWIKRSILTHIKHMSELEGDNEYKKGRNIHIIELIHPLC